MKKLTLTALLTAVTLTSVAFAAPHPNQDYTTDQTWDWGYTGGLHGTVIAPHRLWGTTESDPAVQADYAAHARISAEDAARTAFSQAPGEVKNVRLGVEKGVLVYEVIVGNSEVLINAGSGATWGSIERYSSTVAALAEEQGGDTTQ